MGAGNAFAISLSRTGLDLQAHPAQSAGSVRPDASRHQELRVPGRPALRDLNSCQSLLPNRRLTSGRLNMRNEDWLRLSLPTMAFGLMALGFGLSERSRLSGYDETPQVLACEELGRLGPGDNIHVTLADFLPCAGDAVVLEYENSPRWHSAYLPVFPASLQAEPRPEELRVVLGLPAGDEADLRQRLALDRPTGIVERLRDDRGRPESLAQVLSQAYPGLDPQRCLVLHVGWSGPSSNLARYGPPTGAGMMVLGVVGFGLGMVRRYREAGTESFRAR